jgi:putative ABC transport system substrate-binding protein
MRRREFIAGLGGAATWPVMAWAQQPSMPVVGFLSSRSPSESSDAVAAFLEAWLKLATSKVKTSQSNFVGPKDNTGD